MNRRGGDKSEGDGTLQLSLGIVDSGWWLSLTEDKRSSRLTEVQFYPLHNNFTKEKTKKLLQSCDQIRKVTSESRLHLPNVTEHSSSPLIVQ